MCPGISNWPSKMLGFQNTDSPKVLDVKFPIVDFSVINVTSNASLFQTITNILKIIREYSHATIAILVASKIEMRQFENFAR